MTMLVLRILYLNVACLCWHIPVNASHFTSASYAPTRYFQTSAFNQFKHYWFLNDDTPI